MSAPALIAREIEACYGASQILFGLNLEVDKGEIVALLGRNGAGKTTTFRALIGLLPLRRGYVVTLNADAASFAAASLEVQAGQFLTNNVTLHAGDTLISGGLKDAATGTAIPGVALYALSVAQTDTGEFASFSFAFALTDGSGAFSIQGQNGDWALDPIPQQLARLGYLGLSNPVGVTITNGIGTNVSIALPKFTALIHGQIKTQDGRPLSGVQVSAADNDLGFQSLATTDSKGNYTLGIIAGNWSVEPSFSSLDGLGYQGPDSATLLVEDGSATAQDFSVAPVALSISTPALLANGSIQFQVTGESGMNYGVEVSTDLKSWALAHSFRLSRSPYLYVDQSTKAPVTFYRIQRQP